VAFVPQDDANQIGWIPLGPGDPYAPRYYDANWQPLYLTRTSIVPAQLINLGIPGAVTVVPVDAFGRSIDPRSIRRIDQQRFASNRSTLDPLTLTPLRNAVIHSAWGRGKIDLPPGIAKKLRDTPVFVAGDLRDSRFRKDLAKSMRVERVSDKARNQKDKVKDNRDAKDDRRESQPGDQARKQEIDRLKAEGAKGSRDAQRQARQLEQQQKKETRAQEKGQPKAQPQPRGERVANPAKLQAPPPNKHEAKQQSQGASKQERKQESPSQSGGQGHGGGGKGKGKGKP
jgi:hypothetical protein